MKVSFKDAILKTGCLCLLLDLTFLLCLCFFDSCPVSFEYFFLFFFSVFIPMHLFLIVAFFLISSCLSSVAHESQENLFLRISAAYGAVWVQSAELCR